MDELEPVEIGLLRLVELGDDLPPLRLPLLVHYAGLLPPHASPGDVHG